MSKKPYDYERALVNASNADLYASTVFKRVLRRLVRQAVQQYWDEWGGESHEDAKNRIAKELVP
jgi:hypothetical protein